MPRCPGGRSTWKQYRTCVWRRHLGMHRGETTQPMAGSEPPVMLHLGYDEEEKSVCLDEVEEREIQDDALM